MCYDYKDAKNAGISGQATEIRNTIIQGQCSRCRGAIYPNMLCGIENGELVCGSRVRELNLLHLSYSENVLEVLRNTQTAQQEWNINNSNQANA